MDGLPGLFVPGSMEGDAARETMGNIGSGLGTSISFAQSAGQQIAMKHFKLKRNVFRTTLMLLMLLFETATATAQPQSIVKGIVVDKENSPVIGASVIQKGTVNGAITDLNGNFALPMQGNKPHGRSLCTNHS